MTIWASTRTQTPTTVILCKTYFQCNPKKMIMPSIALMILEVSLAILAPFKSHVPPKIWIQHSFAIFMEFLNAKCVTKRKTTIKRILRYQEQDSQKAVLSRTTLLSISRMEGRKIPGRHAYNLLKIWFFVTSLTSKWMTRVSLSGITGFLRKTILKK